MEKIFSLLQFGAPVYENYYTLLLYIGVEFKSKDTFLLKTKTSFVLLCTKWYHSKALIHLFIVSVAPSQTLFLFQTAHELNESASCRVIFEMKCLRRLIIIISHKLYQICGKRPKYLL